MARRIIDLELRGDSSNVVEVEDIKTHNGSPYGNDSIELTLDEIAGLLSGKVYYHDDGEYGHYILIPEVKEEE